MRAHGADQRYELHRVTESVPCRLGRTDRCRRGLTAILSAVVALTQAVTPKLKARHPDWQISDRAAVAEIRYMDEELAGTKQRPVPQPD